MKKVIYILIISVLISCTKQEQPAYFVEGVKDPQISLNGKWEINTDPAGESREISVPGNMWKEIQVPGECMMQGFEIQHDKPFYYRKYFTVPQDFDNKIIRLRFDGVYSYARVWVNDHYVSDHSGGFTRWDCEITQYVTAGDTTCLIVEVTDKADEISYASGYAKHPIGGILRDVCLMAYPANYPEKINIITDLDELYKNAILEVGGELIQTGRNAKIRLELWDLKNNRVDLENPVISLVKTRTFQIKNHLINPAKWDSEHPNLYSLKVIFLEDNKIIWCRNYNIGFREIEIQGNKLLINGRQIKLRGACRHDIHPLLGRVSTPDYELQDVKLAKEANINFIRTSHYPPTDNLLTLCDEYGLYVEDESAVCFVGTHRTSAYYPGSSENAENFTEQYMSQMEEMVLNHRNHPSVIIWSLGNESSYGINFKKSYEWVKKNDPWRPIIFSYPGLVPEGERIYDILSMHYPGIHGDLEQYGKVTNSFGYPDMPVIFDEWAHVPCYNNFTLQEDPNIRDFWGISLDSMWQNVFEADAATGGAIWGMIDETFMMPDSVSGFGEWWGVVDENVIPSGYSGITVGYGEWGIIDTWRRKKPEFWGTKKAYSPVKLLTTSFKNYKPGDSLAIPVLNRFDHTNLNELKILLTYKDKKTELKPIYLEPHFKGIITLSLEEWDPGEPVFLSFIDPGNNLVDIYRLQNETGQPDIPGITNNMNIEISQDKNQLIVDCYNNTQIIFDKSTGLISKIQTPDDTVRISGPFLNLRTMGRTLAYTYNEIKDYGHNWQLKSLDFNKTDESVAITCKGIYDDLSGIEFEININPENIIGIRYKIQKMPEEYIREIGIKWILDDTYDSLSWDRVTYWETYPDEYVSPIKGRIALYFSEANIYREEPRKNWINDTKSFYYDNAENEVPGSMLTYIARATKENVNAYSLIKRGQEVISVLGNGEADCRLAKIDKQLMLFVNNKMDYVDLSWGNYQRNILLEDNYVDEVIIKIK
jgi:hypothetical protein